LSAPEVDISGRQVLQTFMVPLVIVVIDELLDLFLEGAV